MTNNENTQTPNSHKNEMLVKILFIVGLYASFLFSGIYEEKLYKGTYFTEANEKLKFNRPFLAIFLNSVISYIISKCVLLSMEKPKVEPFKQGDKLLLGTYYMGSRIFADSSLGYLDFISKIIGKSCKSVSIIVIYFLYNLPFVGNRIIKPLLNLNEDSKINTHGWNDLIKVVITTSSIILFNLEDGSSDGNQLDVFKTLLLGYGLLIISLFFDGLMALKEKVLNHEVHNNTELSAYKSRLGFEYMELFSFYSFIFSIFGLAYDFAFSDLYQQIGIYLQNSQIVTSLFVYSLTVSLGQIFIFQFLEKYGPLTLSIITGVRKILSIALSIIFFGKAVSTIKIISLILGTTVIAWEVSDKTTKTHDAKHSKTKSK